MALEWEECAGDDDTAWSRQDARTIDCAIGVVSHCGGPTVFLWVVTLQFSNVQLAHGAAMSLGSAKMQCDRAVAEFLVLPDDVDLRRFPPDLMG
jgi:hypothetical protein